MAKVKEALDKAGHTLKSIWEDVMASMKKQEFTKGEIKEIYIAIKQMRY